MRRLANLFLLLFIATATFGIANEALRLFWGSQLLHGHQQTIGFTCVGVGIVVYLGLGFNKHLPKSVLIPLFIWLGWMLLDYWPLEDGIGDYFRLYASCWQLLLGIIILRLNRQLNNISIFFTSSQLTGSSFSGRNLFFFCLISIPVIPVGLLLISYSIVGQLIATTTANFVKLKPNGLYISERVYQQENKQIRLAGMIHLAEQSFYDDLTASIPNTKTIILAEGVSDNDNLLAEQFGYNKIAGLLGLTSQEQVHFQGRRIETINATAPISTGQNLPDILRADIDLSQFNPQTLDVLSALARHILNSDSLADGYSEFNRWAMEHTEPGLNDIVMNDLIHKRNQVVIGYLSPALNKYDTVVIPWGALHMKGIEKAVQEKDFILKRNRERLSINFLLLPYGDFWKKLTKS